MKNATKFCIITIVIGMLLAFTIFTLFANGMLTLDTSSPFLNILILFCSQIPMIIRQVPCWYKFFDQRVAVFNPSAQTTHCIFTGCTSGEVHHSEYGKR